MPGLQGRRDAGVPERPVGDVLLIAGELLARLCSDESAVHVEGQYAHRSLFLLAGQLIGRPMGELEDCALVAVPRITGTTFCKLHVVWWNQWSDWPLNVQNVTCSICCAITIVQLIGEDIFMSIIDAPLTCTTITSTTTRWFQRTVGYRWITYFGSFRIWINFHNSVSYSIFLQNEQQ